MRNGIVSTGFKPNATVYVPILDAFKKELYRIYLTNPSKIASSLIEYLVGNKDFYKVIKSDNAVEIQAYNLLWNIKPCLPKY